MQSEYLELSKYAGSGRTRTRVAGAETDADGTIRLLRQTDVRFVVPVGMEFRSQRQIVRISRKAKMLLRQTGVLINRDR